MATGAVLDREEYIEQAYFFRVLRDRLAAGMATQDVLERIDQEILSTTRLPYAVQFLSAELKHTGQLSSGFARLPHYFTPFQAFVMAGAEEEARRFPMDSALLVLQREAEHKASQPRGRACSSTNSRCCRATASATTTASRRWRPTRSTTATGPPSSAICVGRSVWWTSPTSCFYVRKCM